MKKTLLVLFLGVLLVPSVSHAQTVPYGSFYALQQQVATLTTQIQELQSKLDSLSAKPNPGKEPCDPPYE